MQHLRLQKVNSRRLRPIAALDRAAPMLQPQPAFRTFAAVAKPEDLCSHMLEVAETPTTTSTLVIIFIQRL